MFEKDCLIFPFQSSSIASWTPIPVGSLKLNFSGSALGNLGQLGIGGIIRGSVSAHLLSFSSPYGFCLVNEAKLIALWTGLCEAV